MKRATWWSKTRPEIDSDLTPRQSLFMCLVIVGLILFACVAITIGMSSGEAPIDAWRAWQIMATGLHDTLPWSLPTLATAAIALPPASQYLLNQADRASTITRDLQWIGLAGHGTASLMLFLALGVVINAASNPIHIAHALVVVAFGVGVITVGVKVGTFAVPPAHLRLEVYTAAYEAAKQREKRLHAPGPLPLKRWQALLVTVTAATTLCLPAHLLVGTFSSLTLWGITSAAALIVSSWYLYIVGDDVGKRGPWMIAQRISVHLVGWVCMLVTFLLLALDLGIASMTALLPLVVAVSVPAVSTGYWLRRLRGPVARRTIRAAAERHALAMSRLEIERTQDALDRLRPQRRRMLRERL